MWCLMLSWKKQTTNSWNWINLLQENNENKREIWEEICDKNEILNIKKEIFVNNEIQQVEPKTLKRKETFTIFPVKIVKQKTIKVSKF